MFWLNYQYIRENYDFKEIAKIFCHLEKVCSSKNTSASTSNSMSLPQIHFTITLKRNSSRFLLSTQYAFVMTNTMQNNVALYETLQYLRGCLLEAVYWSVNPLSPENAAFRK